MLRRLRIENLVLIREAELTLAPGLIALTGETGAGKTIVTQAIGLLLGAKGDAAAVGAAGGEAYVEAELDVPDGFFDEEGLESLRDPEVTASLCCGSARKLGSGGWLVGWGSITAPVIGEYAADGSRLFKLRYPNAFSYRAFPVPPNRVSAAQLRQGMDAMAP